MDKKLKLIYNPFSGRQSLKNQLKSAIDYLRGAGYDVHVFHTESPGDIDRHIAGLPQGFYDVVATAGGDGTMNIVANALLRHGHSTPMLLIPSGTANDFASSLRIPRNVVEAATLINYSPVACDVGLVNGRYFLNVCAAGFLADISQVVNKKLKDYLGNLAYGLTIAGKLSRLTPLRVRITTSRNSFEEEIYLFLALNSSGIGGYNSLSPEADLRDGLLDIIIVKAVSLLEFLLILFKLFTGRHLHDPNVIYFQDSWVRVEALSKPDGFMGTDVDGEVGPPLPITIENQRHSLNVFSPEEVASGNL